MTSEDIRSQLEKHPFVQFRLHLVSGKTFDVRNPSLVSLLSNAIMITQSHPRNGYDIISLRNIERLEELGETE
jgi:hypothetical protein